MVCVQQDYYKKLNPRPLVRIDTNQTKIARLELEQDQLDKKTNTNWAKNIIKSTQSMVF